MLLACRLMELEATPGIEPGYTVLQSVGCRFPNPLTLTIDFSNPSEMSFPSPFFVDVHGILLHFMALSGTSIH